MKRHHRPGPRVKDQLRNLDVRPSKERGQNFVINPVVIDAIAGFGQPTEGDNLVEIGPGLGALTGVLARYPKLTLIEIEAKFCRELAAKYPHVKILNADVRGVDLAEIGDDLVVFGNLPYAFSTDIVFRLIDQAAVVKRAVLLLQKEFAERLAADPGGRTYGLLSVSCRLWADAKLGPIIPGDAFHPPAKVQSQVVELTFLKAPRLPIADILWFKRFVAACFLKRRKKLINSLTASGLFTKEKIAATLLECGVDGNRRAETLSLDEFAKLAQAFPKPAVMAYLMQPPAEELSREEDETEDGDGAA
jgi:16S rRNA (adenine1518-N6/adenine1519-N6)-dimethyltransferase